MAVPVDRSLPAINEVRSIVSRGDAGILEISVEMRTLNVHKEKGKRKIISTFTVD